MAEFGEGEGGGGTGGGDEEVVVDAACVVVLEDVGDPVAVPCISLIIPPIAEVTEPDKLVVLDCIPVADEMDCMSLIIPASAAVTEASGPVEPDGNSAEASGQEPSLFA